jgi:acyl carrier protein
MSEQDWLRFTGLVASVLDVSATEISRDAQIADYADSLSTLELVAMMEQEFSIDIAAPTSAQPWTFGDLHEHALAGHA